MKIAIVVHGRFHAFDLARALIGRGHDVTVFTNYPRFACRRFGLPGDRVRGLWLHGILARGLQRIGQWTGRTLLEARIHSLFARWAARQVVSDHWDVVHVFSGVAEEVLTAMRERRTVRVLGRGSSHVRTQARLLEEEEARVGMPIDRPSPWMIAREVREYEAADRILVLSTFAYDSFIDEGMSPTRLIKMVPGTPVEEFRASPEAIEARSSRILSGAPLRLLYVGTLSFRKGLMDLAHVIKQMDPHRYRFTLVGPQAYECSKVLGTLVGRAQIVPKQAQHELKRWYLESDLLVFPTIEDGFALVLAQAQAAGLPVITTCNSAAHDLIREGESGWVVPIRSPQAIIEQLRRCDLHREELAAMVRRVSEGTRVRTWDDAAKDFEAALEPLVRRRKPIPEGPTPSPPFTGASERRSGAST